MDNWRYGEVCEIEKVGEIGNGIRRNLTWRNRNLQYVDIQ